MDGKAENEILLYDPHACLRFFVAPLRLSDYKSARGGAAAGGRSSGQRRRLSSGCVCIEACFWCESTTVDDVIGRRGLGKSDKAGVSETARWCVMRLS